MGTFLFVVSMICFLIAVGALLTAIFSDEKLGAAAAFVVAAIVGGLLLFLSCVTTVGTRNVGFGTKFGKPTGAFGPGFHTKSPFENVSEWDGKFQPFVEDVGVRLGNSSTATVGVTVQWQLELDKNAITLFKNYKNPDAIRDQVVSKQTQRSLNDAFITFNPLVINQDGTTVVKVTDLIDKAEAEVKQKLPQGITLISLTFSSIKYSDAVQGQIDSITSGVAQTINAKQLLLTNQALAAANDVLAKDGKSLTPAVLAQNCLTIVKNAASSGQPLPPTLSCNFSGNANNGVLVGAK